MEKKRTLLCVCLLSVAVLSAANFSDLRLEKQDLPAVSAGKLIRALNLFPKDDVNVIKGGGGLENGCGIVEKRFRFPNVVGDPGEVSLEDLGHHAGYYNIEHSHSARMFYFFFESRNSKKDPVVIWLTGGPGCSSELAMFYENGPFAIADNMSLVWNNHGWDKALLLLGFEVEEAVKLRQLLKELEGEFLQIIFCTEDMIPRSLWEAMHTNQANLETLKIAKPLPRICFLSGLSGEEMMMFIDAFPEAGLEPAVFAALVPNSADKPLRELIEEIMGDHEMLTAQKS